METVAPFELATCAVAKTATQRETEIAERVLLKTPGRPAGQFYLLSRSSWRAFLQQLFLM